MANNPSRLSSVIEKSCHLDHLVRMLRQQQALLGEIQGLLPSSLARHCLHARIRGESLVIHVDSPAWASKLRFQGQALLRALRAKAPNLRKLSVRILQPESPRPVPPALSRRQASPLAKAINDEELRRLLEERNR